MTFDEQIACRTLAQEVRGEPLIGQQAVAHVILNRWRSGRWGKSLASVCLWRGQFSGWYVPSDPNFAYACALHDDDPIMAHMLGVLNGAKADQSDPTDSATHYVNLSVVRPVWITGAIETGKFGAHTFYKGVK